MLKSVFCYFNVFVFCVHNLNSFLRGGGGSLLCTIESIAVSGIIIPMVTSQSEIVPLCVMERLLRVGESCWCPRSAGAACFSCPPPKSVGTFQPPAAG